MSKAIRKIITDNGLWETYSKNGIMNVRKHYTWESHAAAYARQVDKIVSASNAPDMATAKPKDAVGRRLLKLKSFLVTDIDNTLIGEDNTHLQALLEWIMAQRECIGFGVATGRHIDSAREILRQYDVPRPDFIISSVGSEIYYGTDQRPGQGWVAHIATKWQRNKIESLLGGLSYLQYQEEETQRPFKISYYMEPGKDRLPEIHNILSTNKYRYNLIYSHDKYLDILPFRASKGKALRYLSYKWEIPLKSFLVCGDSGNDEEMLRGEPCAVVVGNYSHEMAALKGSRNVFFAKPHCAGGIMEGLQHYGIIDTSKGIEKCPSGIKSI